ncbi:MAG: hypothetical protein OEM60_04215 [Gammaproteobacteria bacterium]|nr:hypothetical protein [Gammaproteobacteria bacterium]MDH3433033.1 hypothetical protein [Gammaproteobacteria bacterium]
MPLESLAALLSRFGLTLGVQAGNQPVTGSFWGDREAGIVGRNVYVRDDTPIHSLLHESCHIICATPERREQLETDAGGDDLEEAAVCYLQIILADEIDGVGRRRLMQDMDAWGYSFRLGATGAWFEKDAEDARKWLIDCHLLSEHGVPTFILRA